MKVAAQCLHRKKELPMTSLIDVVFLLLAYFMVTSSLIRKEADLPFSLPLSGGRLLDYPIEVLVELNAAGEIFVESEGFPAHEVLVQRLLVLKAAADASQSELTVSVLPADKTRHSRIVTVMDACAAAGVTNLSFSTPW